MVIIIKNLLKYTCNHHNLDLENQAVAAWSKLFNKSIAKRRNLSKKLKNSIFSMFCIELVSKVDWKSSDKKAMISMMKLLVGTDCLTSNK